MKKFISTIIAIILAIIFISSAIRMIALPFFSDATIGKKIGSAFLGAVIGIPLNSFGFTIFYLLSDLIIEKLSSFF